MEGKTTQKELEKIKRQRVDLLDKSEEYKDLQRENERLSHEVKHATSYIKDGQKKIQELAKTIEEYQDREKDNLDLIERLHSQI